MDDVARLKAQWAELDSLRLAAAAHDQALAELHRQVEHAQQRATALEESLRSSEREVRLRACSRSRRLTRSRAA